MASTVSAAAARTLCTQAELDLVQASYAGKIKELTPAQLRQKVTRARKLRDKYRDLAKQQRGEARGKRKAKSTRASQGNENTKKKATLFQETLDRFEQKLSRLEKDAAKSSNSTARKKTTRKAPTRKTAKKSTGRTSTSKKSATQGSASAAASGTTSSKKKSAGKKASAKKSAAKKSKAKKAPEKSSADSSGASKQGGGALVKKQRARKARTSVSMAASGSSLGAAPAGNASAAGWPGAKADVSSRKTRRQDKSSKANFGATQNQFAATSTQKIQGHISGQNKRNQAKRDA